MENILIKWADSLQAIAQNGLLFSKDPFDRERFHAIRQIACEMLSKKSKELNYEKIMGIFCNEIGYATP